MGGINMQSKDIKILLVDDHSIVRYGIRSLIERNTGLSVCGEAENLLEAYEKVRELKPDVVLLDLKLPDGDGATGCREIKKIQEDIKVIILTAYADDTIVVEAVRAGADGYLLKNIDSKTIIEAIRDVFEGKSVLDSTVLPKVLRAIKSNSDSHETMTPQEKRILDFISEGKTNKEIGEELFKIGRAHV